MGMTPHEYRLRAIELVEAWWQADREATNKPQHALVTVQEMHLTDGDGSTVRGSQKRTGRSMPPINDIARHLRTVDRIMRHVWNTNPAWRKALEAWAEHGSTEKAAQARRVKPHEQFRDFDHGVVVVQSEIVRLGL